MSQPIIMDRSGRIVLPVSVRRSLNLGPGSRLTLEVVAQRIELTPEPAADSDLLVLPSKRTVSQPTGKAFDAAAATRDEREAQERRGGQR